MKRTLPFAIIVIVLACAIGAGWWYLKHSQTTIPAIGARAKANASSSPATVPQNAPPGAQPLHVRGPDSAPVTLEEFGDFECPPCGGVYPILKTMESEFGSRIRVIFREFPLTQVHPHAAAAARAAEAAGLQGKFFEMHDLIYQNQAVWKDTFDVRPIFEGYARSIGLDIERFKRDQAGDEVDNRITLDGIRAHALGVTGTPTVYLNNQEVPFETVKQADTLRATIKLALGG
jgi:formate-nitrite transporter family protein